MKFKADPENDNIIVNSRNLGALGEVTYSLSIEQITPLFLDQLGREILGRPSNVFKSLIKVS